MNWIELPVSNPEKVPGAAAIVPLETDIYDPDRDPVKISGWAETLPMNWIELPVKDPVITSG